MSRIYSRLNHRGVYLFINVFVSLCCCNVVLLPAMSDNVVLLPAMSDNVGVRCTVCHLINVRLSNRLA